MSRRPDNGHSTGRAPARGRGFRPKSSGEKGAVTVSNQAAWTVKQWREHVPIAYSTLYSEIRAGHLAIAKVGTRTLIVTPPQAYLASKTNKLLPPKNQGTRGGGPILLEFTWSRPNE